MKGFADIRRYRVGVLKIHMLAKDGIDMCTSKVQVYCIEGLDWTGIRIPLYKYS